MRTLLLLSALLTACTSSSTDSAPPDGVRPVADFGTEPRVHVWPRVPLVPENAVTFRITAEHTQSPGGPEFTIYQVRGEQAVAMPAALPRWKWSEDLTQAIVEPVGLERGAPYLLVGEGLQGPDGPYTTFAHGFRIIPADTTRPDGASLDLRGDVTPGQRGVLTLTFPEPMREDVVHSVATLLDGVPQPVPWHLHDDQRTLTWTPPEPWPAGAVHVSVGGSAKDVAGNTLNDPPTEPLVPAVPATPEDPKHREGGGE